MTLLHRITRNHGPFCTESPCICTEKDRNKQEARQYWITGILAYIAGIIGGLIGWNFSMTALSDALHAFADGSADMWGVWVMQKINKNPEQQKQLRRNGTKIIALFLLAGALMILHEAVERFSGNGYTVSPVWIIVAGLATGLIDLSRLTILALAQKESPNEMRGGLIIHAATDLVRSLAIASMGFLMWVAEMLTVIDITPSLRILDLSISVLLALLMFRLAFLMWQGKHHGHKTGDYILHILKIEVGHHHH